MRVSIRKSTGSVIEMQSIGDAGVMIQNAVNGGIDESDVEIRVVTAAEYAALLEPDPIIDRSDMSNADKLQRAAYIYLGSLSGKTPAEVKAGIKAAYDELPGQAV